MGMGWPRGKWNGRRIVGISIKVRLLVNHWYWRPKHYSYMNDLHWGCFSIWIEAEYAPFDK